MQGAGRRCAWLARGRARRACWRWAWAQARARQAAEARRHWGGRRWGAQARGRASGRAAGLAGARQGERARGWASGRAAGRMVRAGHDQQAARARSLCAQAGPAGPGWGFVHPAWFSASFFFVFDSVFFLSH